MAYVAADDVRDEAGFTCYSYNTDAVIDSAGVAVANEIDCETNRLWLPTGAPVNNLVLSPTTALLEPTTRSTPSTAATAEPTRSIPLCRWTAQTLSVDVKQALIDLIGLLQAVMNFFSNPDDPTGVGSGDATGALKWVPSGGYTEKCLTTGAEVMWKAKAAQLS